MTLSTRIHDSGGLGSTENPNKKLPFEISIPNSFYAFIPEFYPELRQTKDKELDRYGEQTNGESVSIKQIKNREFHIKGSILRDEIAMVNLLLDYDGPVDMISPLTPDGGMECLIEGGEIGKQVGWDPLTRQREFAYSMDLVSTGSDEYNRGANAIVTAILGEDEGEEALEAYNAGTDTNGGAVQ